MRRWALQGQHRAEGTVRRERGILAWLRPHLAGFRLVDISRHTIDAIRAAKLEEGAGPRSANYVAGIVQTIMAAAADWGWIERAPRIKPLKLPPARVRWLTREEANALLDQLRQPLRDMAELTLLTGLRWSNVSGLKWTHVDLRAGLIAVSAREMKGRAGLCLPITPRLRRILDGRRGQHATWVFSTAGKRLQRPPHETWYGALRRLGLEDFRWHDLRHTWASWHAQRGTPMLVLQQAGGWKSASMVNRYAHLDTRTLAVHATAFEAELGPEFAQNGVQGELFTSNPHPDAL
ncbi:tyrosine-type recombinase/integrase [Solimonas fluminis]|uniref:tyrosine-type recombinase/integrase n=1 Tax=Solimonas fluminis TaxID=2086571 RepID=UPI000DF1D7E2|nr:site-specific integrase [Solimonas fluminis]